ncbi:translation protein SH3-like domain-containing protein [Cantharellus anzutake]|uniref:translation protein SH3-like domain-containing protein n=1 Tax=Cantharellus anzutake TaxID=1750568 RepID=UPI00190678F5|nr:translation protein SH3-like domain-containing protein [Cantharellus anzutake]KAF8332709.1 translation protein SH3-like domain-containing protein [Cantharellus anzutake]
MTLKGIIGGRSKMTVMDVLSKIATRQPGVTKPTFISVPRTTREYPFSKVVKVSEPQQFLPASLLKGAGLMAHVDRTLPSPTAQSFLNRFFLGATRGSKITPGSVVSVTSTNGIFAGVVISVRNKGADANFTLRNVIQRTGVEFRFNVSSPHIKDIKVISRAGGKEPRDGKRMRRAKLFYLRDQPAKMTAISASVKKASQ